MRRARAFRASALVAAGTAVGGAAVLVWPTPPGFELVRNGAELVEIGPREWGLYTTRDNGQVWMVLEP